MNFKGLKTAVAALSLVTAPTIAAAAPISTPLTQPATETVEGENELRGGRGGFFVAIIAVAVVILGIIIVINEDDEPNSP